MFLITFPAGLLFRGAQTAVQSIIGERLQPHIKRALEGPPKPGISAAAAAGGVIAGTALGYGANIAYKNSLSPNDRWRYEHFEIVNSIVDLKRLTPYLGSNSLLEGSCYGLTVNKQQGPNLTSLVAINNLGTNGSYPLRTMLTSYAPFYFKNISLQSPHIFEGKMTLIQWQPNKSVLPSVYSLMTDANDDYMLRILHDTLKFSVVYQRFVKTPLRLTYGKGRQIIAVIHSVAQGEHDKLWTCAIVKGTKVIEIDSVNSTCTNELDIDTYMKDIPKRELNSVFIISL
jgi:hypothetical protein